MKNSRTILEFDYAGNIRSPVEIWAKAEGFRLKQKGANGRIYQKGRGLIILPIMVKIIQNAEKVRIEAWVKGMWFNKNSMIDTPDEMALESGGFVFFAARNKGRKVVNKLLAELNQLPIP